MDMLRGVVLCGALAFTAGPAFAEFCEGPADDGNSYFTVDVDKGANGKPETTTLQQDAARPYVFTVFADITPAAPTDERYRYVFHDEGAAAGEFAVMLMEGGFTQRLTAQIWRLTEAEPEALATLNCQR